MPPTAAPSPGIARAFVVPALAGLVCLCGLLGCESPPGAVAPTTTMDAASHEPFFPILSGHHGGIACDACHGASETFQEFSCIDCHMHEQAGTDEAHLGVSAYSYTSPACLGCHPRGDAAGSVDDHNRIFPISANTAHGGVACTECHLSRDDRSQVACATCHEAAATAAEHTMVGGFAQESALCLRCHGDSQVDPIVDHLPFLIAHAAPHAGEDCLSCHPAARAEKPFAADFTVRECTGCHLEPDTRPLHDGVAGFEYGTPQCLTCHPTGTSDGPGFNHERNFPITAGTAHQDVACAECHASTADRSQLLCATCHDEGTTRPLHATVGGYRQESALCVRCHADSQLDRVSAHAPFRISGTAPHSNEPCLTCHPALRSDKIFGADFASFDCLGCHLETETQGMHNGVEVFAYDNPSCISCHPDGAIGEIDHTFFPIQAGSNHGALDCHDCHANRADHTDTACAICHEPAVMAPAHAPVAGFRQEGPLCKRCHADGQVDRIADHGPFLISGAAPHTGELCLGCHARLRADKPWGAQFTSSACVGCHHQAETTTSHAGVSGFQFNDGACLFCHPSGAGGEAVDHTPFFPIGAGSAHETVTCAECHADPNDHANVACATCHQVVDMTLAHATVGGYQQVSTACERCHADSQVDRNAVHLPFRITSGKHFRKSCVECHPEVRSDRPFVAADFAIYDCLGCHRQGETDGNHRGRSGYAYISTTCTDSGCHPDGRN